MRLELAEFPVEQIRLSRRFAYDKRTLEVDEAVLVDIVLGDRRITDASLAVAMPGENVRITAIRDIVEPRCKVSGGTVFPGILGPVANVGDGRTHRLSGMTVIAAAAYEGTIRAGVILQRIRFETNHGKQVGAQNAARLAKAMGADGTLITWIGGGNAFVDVMFTVRACEQIGIKTTLVTYENGGKQGTDSAVLFYVPEAGAIVSTGSLDRPIELPAMERTIGPYDELKVFPFPGAASVSAQGPLSLEARDAVIGGADIWGEQSWRCEEF